MGRRRTRKTVSTYKHDARASVLSRNTTRSRVVLVFASAIKSAQIHKMARPGNPVSSLGLRHSIGFWLDGQLCFSGERNGIMPAHDWTRVPAGSFHDVHQR